MCYAKKLIAFDYRGNEKNLGPDFNGQFDCAQYNCGGCDHGLVEGEPPKRNLGSRIKFCFDESKIPLKRFPFTFERQLGSGGFATVYKGFFHGVERAFKVIPLDEEEHKYDVKSYGCHEYNNQENDLKSGTTFIVGRILIKVER